MAPSWPSGYAERYKKVYSRFIFYTRLPAKRWSPVGDVGGERDAVKWRVMTGPERYIYKVMMKTF